MRSEALLFPCLFFLAFSSMLSSGCALDRASEIEVSEITRIVFFASAGDELEIETVDLSPNSDPVLHLLATSTNTQVAYNDNFGAGPAAKISVTLPETQEYTLIVRSKSASTQGYCTLRKNQARWRTDIPFGGTHFDLRSLPQGEWVEFIKPVDGPHAHIVLVTNRAKNTVTDLLEGEYFSRYTVPATQGRQDFIIGSLKNNRPPHDFPGKRLRIYVNNAPLPGSDADGDGLGDKLERAIGTCVQLQGTVRGKDGSSFDCALAADPRDTDGDGIRDDYELLGKRQADRFLPLPAWGSDPRHKDLFMEVDFGRENKAENDTLKIEKMPVANARFFAEIYADAYEAEPFFQIYNATVLRNPDNLPGINAHLDIGIPPDTITDRGIYGDWGGFTAINAIVDNENNWGRISGDEAWKQHLDPFRVGIFRYGLGDDEGAGQCDVGLIWCLFNFNDHGIPAHETGHAFGLGHSGISYYYPNGADPNCNPAYYSIMNYLYQSKKGVGFSSRAKYFPLNNFRVEEWEAVDPGLPFFGALKTELKYYVDEVHGHVDWNRDGSFAPVGTKVKAYINYAPGNSCEYTRYNQIVVPNVTTKIPPVIAKLRDQLFLFHQPLESFSAIQHQTSDDDWQCPVPMQEGCDNDSWSAPKSSLLGTVGGFDVANIGYRANERLLLVSNWENGFLWYSELSVDPSGLATWSPPGIIRNATIAKGTPSLARINGDQIMLCYRGEDDTLRHRFYQQQSGQWSWTAEQIAQDSTGRSIAMKDAAYPSIIQAPLEWNNSRPTIYGAFYTTYTNHLDLWAYNNVGDYWEPTGLIEPVIWQAMAGKPEMAWIPAQGHFNGLGRLYLLHNHQANTVRIPHMLMSYHQVDSITGARTQRLGLRAPFDNHGFNSLGFDIFYDPNDPNGNLKFAGEHTKEGVTNLYFRPKANGLNDLTYFNLNDWETMGYWLCKTLIDSDKINQPIQAIICHDPPPFNHPPQN